MNENLRIAERNMDRGDVESAKARALMGIGEILEENLNGE